jgi:hypothetical protein
MAEEKKASDKTLEMRVAELEDKLSKVHITEDELKAFHKVNSLLGGQDVSQATGVPMETAALSPQVCVIQRSRGINRGIINRGITPRGINECSCGPCACDPTGGTFGGGGFGGFGAA